MERMMDWPNDPDGDVFRILKSQGFDFSKEYILDFNVDFDTWAPSTEARTRLKTLIGEVVFFEPDEGNPGFAQFKIRGLVTYEKVVEIQHQITSAMAPYGGRCESWGVMGNAPQD
jgi:hypothetical protein